LEVIVSPFKEAIREAADLAMKLSREELEQFVLDRLTDEIYQKKLTNAYMEEVINETLLEIQ
jgi:hypothetical protein